MPFAKQLPHFRASNVVTGMHGAGYSNIIFLSPGSVVAELCPMGYCTESYRRIAARTDLAYIRWTNSISANAKDGYDTIVDTAQFVTLMGKALKALSAGRGAERAAGERAEDAEELEDVA